MLYSSLLVVLLLVLAVLLWPARAHRRFVLAAAAVITLFACGLYAYVGAPQVVPLLEERQVRLGELKALIVEHSEKVKQNPKALESWIALGQAFGETGQYGAAANAFKQAVVLSHGEPQLILAYARSEILEAEGKVTDSAKKSLQMVVLQEPQNPEARYWLIVRKLQDGNAQEAMPEMKALYKTLPEGSPLKSMIDRQIGRN